MPPLRARTHASGGTLVILLHDVKLAGVMSTHRGSKRRFTRRGHLALWWCVAGVLRGCGFPAHAAGEGTIGGDCGAAVRAQPRQGFPLEQVANGLKPLVDGLQEFNTSALASSVAVAAGVSGSCSSRGCLCRSSSGCDICMQCLALIVFAVGTTHISACLQSRLNPLKHSRDSYQTGHEQPRFQHLRPTWHAKEWRQQKLLSRSFARR